MAETKHYSKQRLARVRARMRELELDAIITLDPTNLRWLTAWAEVFDDEPAHLALITQKKASIHTDSRYYEAMLKKNKSAAWHIDASRIRHFEFAQTVLKKMRKESLRLGYESSIRLDVYKALKKRFSRSSIKLVETTALFDELRAVKDEEEVRLLRKAQKITDAAFANLLTWIKPGMSELEVVNRLDFALREQGGEDVAFATIAASGPNSALPHARPTTRRLKAGDFLTLDFGARYHDYCADMTRTLVVGKASSKQQEVYAAVLAAHNRAKAAIKPGITGKEAHEVAVESLAATGYEEYFTHSLGHGLGIAVHEQPGLSPFNTHPLVVGNVVTVEPGVYLPGFGGVRIEDCGLVTLKGFSSFARSPRELIQIAVTA